MISFYDQELHELSHQIAKMAAIVALRGGKLTQVKIESPLASQHSKLTVATPKGHVEVILFLRKQSEAT